MQKRSQFLSASLFLQYPADFFYYIDGFFAFFIA